MLNRDIYVKTPEQLQLANNGVAKVSDARTDAELATLRHELENFVCEGQYHKGIVRVLRAYLDQLQQPEQKAVWVSGFYGSGKSHFLKMLRALWTDFQFADGATARGLVHMPEDVKDLLHELATEAKRGGGLHAAAGTLSAGAGDSVRLAVLAIVMRSRGLPETYPQARLVLWLKDEGLLDPVRKSVEDAGKDWATELNNMYVSTVLAMALRAHVPTFAGASASAGELLQTQFPNVEDISNADLVKLVDHALRGDAGKAGLPLTLIALDEVQQFIGDSVDRSIRLQETVEALSQRLGSRILIVGSGQNALSGGTPTLERLLGRFQVRIELSDADVTAVVREVILKKKAGAVANVNTMLAVCSGEIARHLNGTRIGSRGEDTQHLVADYPLLPVRRRFWEAVLRAVDKGSTGQLRNQLTMVHDAVRQTAQAELGVVVPGDYLFDHQSTNLVQTSELPRESFERIQALRTKGPDGEFQARICGLVFLIGKLPRTEGADLGLRATPDVLADLLVTDLRSGSSELRKRVEISLRALEEDGVLLNIGTEYRLQTRDSAEWENEYRTQATSLEQSTTQIAGLRAQLLREQVTELPPLKKGVVQGLSKVARNVTAHLGADRPQNAHNELTVWVRDGWVSSETEVANDARAAGLNSPMVLVFLPATSADAFRNAIVRWKAAQTTLDVRPMPTEKDGTDARAGMESRRDDGKRECKRLVGEVLANAKVFVGGGQEVPGDDLASAITKALESATVRMYSRFQEADHARWGDVVTDAKKRAAAPFDKLGFSGDTDKHPVAKEILTFIAAGRKGTEIRAHFQSAPFGWPQDAIDGALYALGVTGHLRIAHTTTHAGADITTIPQNQLTQYTFRAETVVITAIQRIGLTKLAQDVGAHVAVNDLPGTAQSVLNLLRKLANEAGGDAPKPALPSQAKLSELEAFGGNALILEMVTAQEELRASFRTWAATRDKIAARMPRWQVLQRLVQTATGLPEAEATRAQVAAVLEQRLLLQDPDPVPGLCDQLTQTLRTKLAAAVQAFQQAHDAGMADLKADANWTQLSPEQKHGLLTEHQLLPVPEPKVGTEQEVLAALADRPLHTWADKRKGLPQRFQDARHDAAKLLEPKVIYAKVPSRTVRTDAELETWIADVRKDLTAKLKTGPLHIS